MQSKWVEAAVAGEFAICSAKDVEQELEKERARKTQLQEKIRALDQQIGELQTQSATSLGTSVSQPESWKRKFLDVTKERVKTLRAQVTSRREALTKLYELQEAQDE